MSDERSTGGLGDRLSRILAESTQMGWRIIRAGKESGPYSDADLVSKAASGELRPDDLVKQADGLWMKAQEVLILQNQFRQVRQEKPPISRSDTPPWVIKSVVAFVVGGLFLVGGWYW